MTKTQVMELRVLFMKAFGVSPLSETNGCRQHRKTTREKKKKKKIAQTQEQRNNNTTEAKNKRRERGETETARDVERTGRQAGRQDDTQANRETGYQP